MRKLITLRQEYEVICDNPVCDYKVPNPTGIPSPDNPYLNKPCPNVGKIS